MSGRPLRSGPSGSKFTGTPGDVLTVDATGELWEAQPVGGGGTYALNRVAYVDGAFPGGASNGSQAAPYTTLQQAVNALASGGVVLIAPGTYAGALTIPAGLKFTFSAIGFSGLLGVFVTGVVTWNISNGGEVAWSGVDLRQADGVTGPIFSDADSGVGAVRWDLISCLQGVQTHDGTTQTHDVEMRAGSIALNGLDNAEPAAGETQLMGFAISGQLQAVSAAISGPGPFLCSFIRTRSASGFETGITVQCAGPGSSFEETGFGAGITIQTAGAKGVASFDELSAWNFRNSNSVFTGVGAVFQILDYNQPVEFDASNAAGAALTLDFSKSHGVSQAFTLSSTSVPCVLTFVDPLTSCVVYTRVIQDGVGGRTVTWPARCINPPTLTPAASAETQILWYFNAASGKYYPIHLGASPPALLDHGTITGATTFDFNEGSIQRATLGANAINITIVPGDIGTGKVGELFQDATGSRVPTLVGGGIPILYQGGSPPTWSTDPNAKDTFSVLYDGTQMLVVAGLGWA